MTRATIYAPNYTHPKSWPTLQISREYFLSCGKGRVKIDFTQ